MARGALLALTVVMLLLAPAQEQLRAETITVLMKDRVFIPEKITVKTGDTVQWVNVDTELHQVISGETLYDRDLGHPMNSGLLMWNTRYAFTFTKPGTYPYMCVIHRPLEESREGGGMVGAVIVTDGQPGAKE